MSYSTYMQGTVPAQHNQQIKKEIVGLTSFIKKSQKTPQKEIDKARKRMLEL